MNVLNGKTVNLSLVGLDGNAFILMGRFKIQAKKENWSTEEIDTVLTECKSGDYDHLLATLIDYCQPTEDYDDEL